MYKKKLCDNLGQLNIKYLKIFFSFKTVVNVIFTLLGLFILAAPDKYIHRIFIPFQYLK